MAALNDFKLHHIDVKNACLNALLDEKIYMIVPKGYSAQYWQLQKGLYGL
jgi:reverse transcriptase-like protein